MSHSCSNFSLEFHKSLQSLRLRILFIQTIGIVVHLSPILLTYYKEAEGQLPQIPILSVASPWQYSQFWYLIGFWSALSVPLRVTRSSQFVGTRQCVIHRTGELMCVTAKGGPRWEAASRRGTRKAVGGAECAASFCPSSPLLSCCLPASLQSSPRRLTSKFIFHSLFNYSSSLHQAVSKELYQFMSLYGWGGVGVMWCVCTGRGPVWALVVILVCISERHSNILLH